MSQDIWGAESNKHVLTRNEQRLESLTAHLFGNRFPGIHTNVSKGMSLYRFLLQHIDVPISQLQLAITEQGKPLFDIQELEAIVGVLRTHLDTPFAKRILGMSGGGSRGSSRGGSRGSSKGSSSIAPVSTAIHTAPSGSNRAIVHPLEADPSRSKFWDKFIRKIMHPIASRIPPSWDGVLWYTFILYSLEQTTVIGPFIATALDTVSLSLPVLAEMSSEITGKLIGLLPVPYAGLGGDIIGYGVSLIFILFAVTLNMSRKHFGTAFKVSLDAIPLFGEVIADAAQSFEIGAERYLNNRAKFLASIGTVSPTAKSFLYYWSPDVEVHTETPPPFNALLPTIGKNVAEFVAEETGMDKMYPSTMIASATTAATAAATTAATTAATAAVTNATKAATTAVTAAANTAITKAANARSPIKGGGRRKTRRKRRT